MMKEGVNEAPNVYARLVIAPRGGQAYADARLENRKKEIQLRRVRKCDS